MRTQKFQPGDLVKLKSGGPLMTVDVSAGSFKQYRCTWFEGKEHYSAMFNENALLLVEPEEKIE